MRDEDAYRMMAKCGGDFFAFNELVFPHPDPDMPSLHPGQIEFMQNGDKKINMLCPGNSWGKTEWITRAHLFWALFKSGMEFPRSWPVEKQARKKRYAEYRTLNCSYNYETADTPFERIVNYRQEIEFVNWLVETVRRREREIVCRTGSIIKIGSLEENGKLIEGDRYYRITVDEIGWIPNFKHIRDHVLQPRLIVPYSAEGGRLYLLGTPKAITDPEVYMMFERGKGIHPDIYSRQGSTYENIYLSAEQIELVKRQYADSPSALRQVLYGEFVRTGGTVFRPDAVRRLFWNELKLPAPYEDGHVYVSSWDYARKQDHTVGITLDITRKPYRIVNYTRVPKSDADWSYIYKLSVEEASRYKVRAFIMDKSGMGGDVIETQLCNLGLPVVGVDFGGQGGTKKINIVQSLVDALDEPVAIDEDAAADYGPHLDHQSLAEGKFVVRGLVKSPPIDQLMKELNYYSWNDKALETDSVMALSMATYHLKRNYAPPPTNADMVAALIRK